MLTQYLGISEEEFIIEPYVSDWFDIHNNYVLLCSDGLVSHLSDFDIKSILRRHISIHDKTNYLLKIALDEGGSDNITLILMGGRDE